MHRANHLAQGEKMHNINTYVGRKAAWHNLGTVFGRLLSAADIKAHGGLNYLPTKEQLADPLTGKLLEAWGVFRRDTGAFFGAVGSDYTVVDHWLGFQTADLLMENVAGAHYETAGVLGAGGTVWGLANLNFSLNVGGEDRHEIYLLFVTSHDGRVSHTYRLTDTRVVCQNTLNVALGRKSAAQLRIRHTANAVTRIEQAQDALANIGADIHGMEERLNFLASRKMTRESMKTLFDRLFPPTVDAGREVVSTRRNNILGDILREYESNDRDAFPSQRGTAYNALNAVTAYVDHTRSARGDRSESAMFGSGDRLKSQAYDVLVELSNGLQEIQRVQYFPPTQQRELVTVRARQDSGGLLDLMMTEQGV
jgi:phage/plasmid-like protein (TIGR03299 family)